MTRSRLRKRPSMPRLRKGRSKFIIGVGISVVVAVGIAIFAHLLVSPQTAPSTYSIDPTPLALSVSDVGTQFTLVQDAQIGPTQKTAYPLPYQQQYYMGRGRDFTVRSALSDPGRTEIEKWQTARGFSPTNPPTIFGPFVADHLGIFEVTDREQSYHTIDATHDDYNCCTFDFADNFSSWRTLSIQLGDEATAWSGIRNSPTHPGITYEEQTFYIHWRRGPIISTIWVFGAHDIALDSALHFAQIVDQRIVSTFRRATKGASHAPNTRDMATSAPVSAALRDIDHRIGQWLDRARSHPRAEHIIGIPARIHDP